MTMRGRFPFRLLACLGFAIFCLAPAATAAERQCTCRYAGQSYALGACVCIDRPGAGPQYACCSMVLNNTSWKFSDKGCPTAMSEPVGPAGAGIFSWEDFAGGPTFALPTPDRQ